MTEKKKIDGKKLGTTSSFLCSLLAQHFAFSLDKKNSIQKTQKQQTARKEGGVSGVHGSVYSPLIYNKNISNNVNNDSMKIINYTSS